MDTRPRQHSSEVMDIAARRMMTAILTYRGEGPEPENLEVLVQQLKEAMYVSPDGFTRALMLFKAGWSPDEAIVRIVSTNSGHERLALKEAEERWVMLTGTRFPAKEGDVVTAIVNAQHVTGKVLAVRSTMARALIEVPGTSVGSGTHDVAAEHVVRRYDGTASVAVDCLRAEVGFHVA